MTCSIGLLSDNGKYMENDKKNYVPLGLVKLCYAKIKKLLLTVLKIKVKVSIEREREALLSVFESNENPVKHWPQCFYVRETL